MMPPLEIIPEPEEKRDSNTFDRWRSAGETDEVDSDGIEIEEDYDHDSDANGYEESEHEISETRAAYRDLLNLQPTGGRTRGPSTSELLDWLKLLLHEDIDPALIRESDPRKLVPPLAGALIKNEQDVHLLERLAFMTRRRKE